MRMSFSRVGCFEKCPYQFKLRYIDGLETLRVPEAADPLILGSAMHKAIEEGADAGARWYHEQFNVSDDAHVAEEMKIRALAPKVPVDRTEGRFEVELRDGDKFIGFVDYASYNPVSDAWTLCDFKYTAPKNADRYRESGQLPVYAYYWEKLGFGKIEALAYLIIPKTQIRQRKTETVFEFRKRLSETLAASKVETVWVPYDREKVIAYFESVADVLSATDYPKEITRLCDWCDYQAYCESDGKETTMLLPKAERRDISKLRYVKLWIYGEPFSGKTTFANAFPKPLMLNTDGNIKFVDAPYISLRDTVETEGRLTKTVHGWETLKDAVTELEKGSNFETVVLDLAEGAYELNRSYIYEKRGWEHESDDSFKAWDIVRKEYYDLMRRLTNLAMNVILISHEDATRDLTKRGGDKVSMIKPNIQDKVAKVVAGMVDLVGRVVVRDGEHLLTFKTDEFVFGGGRLKIDADEIPLDYTAFCELIGLDGETVAETVTVKTVTGGNEIVNGEHAGETVGETVIETETPKRRRGRPRKTETPTDTPQEPQNAPEQAEALETEQTPAEAEKPVRRTRKRRVATEE